MLRGDQKDPMIEDLRKRRDVVLRLVESQNDEKALEILHQHAKKGKKEYELVVPGLMYGVLAYNNLRESLVSIQNLVAISDDDSHEVLGRELIRLLDHDLRFEAMHTVTKMKVIDIVSNIANVAVAFDSLLIVMARLMVGICFRIDFGTSDGSWVAQYGEKLMHLISENLSRLTRRDDTISILIYNLLGMIHEHTSIPLSKRGPLHKWLKLEIDVCYELMQTGSQAWKHHGRDIIRVLARVKKIGKFSEIWNKLANEDDGLALSRALSRATNPRILAGRVSPNMWKDLMFMLKKVYTGKQAKIQKLFVKKFLKSEFSDVLRPDIVRFICGGYHPPNHVLASQILPRYMTIGWLYFTPMKKQSRPTIMRSVLWDMFSFNADDGNVMNIEPAALLLVKSIPKYPNVSAEILKLLTETSSFPFQNAAKSIGFALRKLLKLDVIKPRELSKVLECEKINPSIKNAFKLKFGEAISNSTSKSGGNESSSTPTLPSSSQTPFPSSTSTTTTSPPPEALTAKRGPAAATAAQRMGVSKSHGQQQQQSDKKKDDNKTPLLAAGPSTSGSPTTRHFPSKATAATSLSPSSSPTSMSLSSSSSSSPHVAASSQASSFSGALNQKTTSARGGSSSSRCGKVQTSNKRKRQPAATTTTTALEDTAPNPKLHKRDRIGGERGGGGGGGGGGGITTSGSKSPNVVVMAPKLREKTVAVLHVLDQCKRAEDFENKFLQQLSGVLLDLDQNHNWVVDTQTIESLGKAIAAKMDPGNESIADTTTGGKQRRRPFSHIFLDWCLKTHDTLTDESLTQKTGESNCILFLLRLFIATNHHEPILRSLLLHKSLHRCYAPSSKRSTSGGWDQLANVEQEPNYQDQKTLGDGGVAPKISSSKHIYLYVRLCRYEQTNEEARECLAFDVGMWWNCFTSDGRTALLEETTTTGPYSFCASVGLLLDPFLSEPPPTKKKHDPKRKSAHQQQGNNNNNNNNNNNWKSEQQQLGIGPLIQANPMLLEEIVSGVTPDEMLILETRAAAGRLSLFRSCGQILPMFLDHVRKWDNGSQGISWKLLQAELDASGSNSLIYSCGEEEEGKGEEKEQLHADNDDMEEEEDTDSIRGGGGRAASTIWAVLETLVNKLVISLCEGGGGGGGDGGADYDATYSSTACALRGLSQVLMSHRVVTRCQSPANLLKTLLASTASATRKLANNATTQVPSSSSSSSSRKQSYAAVNLILSFALRIFSHWLNTRTKATTGLLQEFGGGGGGSGEKKRSSSSSSSSTRNHASRMGLVEVLVFATGGFEGRKVPDCVAVAGLGFLVNEVLDAIQTKDKREVKLIETLRGMTWIRMSEMRATRKRSRKGMSENDSSASSKETLKRKKILMRKAKRRPSVGNDENDKDDGQEKKAVLRRTSSRDKDGTSSSSQNVRQGSSRRRKST